MQLINPLYIATIRSSKEYTNNYLLAAKNIF